MLAGPESRRNIGYSDHLMHRYWHYVDVFFSPDHTPLPNTPVPNALTQIAAFRAVLASNAPDELKSYDLTWLLHLVGDLHQPLHCTARVTKAEPNGDAGGNKVLLHCQGCPPKLHAFWDGALGRGGPESVPEFADQIEATRPVPCPEPRREDLG